MDRGKKIIIVSNCILNSNAKVEGLSQYGGVFKELLDILLAKDLGVIQLPCPEVLTFGMRRWGHTKDQFDNLSFRKKCRDILNNTLDEIDAYNKIGYKIVGVIGVDGSPSCGVDLTCRSDEWYGSMENFDSLDEINESVRMVDESGVFMEEFKSLLKTQLNIDLPFIGIDELDVLDSIGSIEDFINKFS